VKNASALAFLILVGWSTFAYFTMHSLIVSQKHYGKLINLSGKQRMLSQKAALHVQLVAMQREDTGILKALLQEMERDHVFIEESLSSEKLKQIYFGKDRLDAQVERFFAMIEHFIKAPSPALEMPITEYSFGLLASLSEAVSMFETENETIVNELQKRERFIYIGTLITLVLEAVLIIMPMIRAQNRYLEELEESVKERTNELADAMWRAEEATKAKTLFLANMSHEIRTPMNAIMGFVEQLGRGEKDPTRLKYLAIIRNSSKTLLRVINDILDLSKIESGKIEIESHPCQLHYLFEDTIAIFSEPFREKKIRFRTEIDAELPRCILTDHVRLKQVVSNLLGNAVKFTPEGGTVTLKVTYDPDKSRMFCSVEDTGIGIAEEKLSTIFRAFEQEDSSTTRKYGGTGLGLSISAKLIQLMGGELGVASKAGEGSRFSFDLPAELCEPETLDTAHPEAAAHNGHAAPQLQGHVLVVEDMEASRMLMGLILQQLGLTFDTAADGVEAVSMVQKHRYDAIMMDENMPNMNGIEATRRIRSMEAEAQQAPVPIIAATADAFSEDKQRFLENGMNDYISKPYDMPKVSAVLAKVLAH